MQNLLRIVLIICSRTLLIDGVIACLVIGIDRLITYMFLFANLLALYNRDEPSGNLIK